MSRRRSFGRLLVILPVTVVLLLIHGAGVALASDNSAPTPYDNDNHSEGFNIISPHDCWRSFDMAYYRDQIWQAFVKGTGAAGDEMAVYIATNAAGATPAPKPTHVRVVEDGETWESSWDGDQRKPNLVRFASFKDRLFLYVAKTYDDNTGSILYQKQIDPIDAKKYVSPNDDTRWCPPATTIWSNRPGSKTTSPRVIQGLVVKVMNDTLNIFVQYGGTGDLYRITSTDAEHFSSPQKIHTFAGNDCLLNGDVIARGEDAQPLLAFVTKDDAGGGKTSAGDCKLWTFDPEARTDAVHLVEYLPLDFKDATVVAGDVAGCTPYGTTNLQVWGIGWTNNNVYHMQYVFNAAGTGGSFNPGGAKDTGHDASVHVNQDWRGYLASCMAPQLTSDNSLQQYARVWWWGSTDIANGHGRSLKYPMDYLKRLAPRSVDTYSTEYSPAWVLEGVIYGLPPYFPNGKQVGSLAEYYKVLFGLEQSDAVTNSVTSEKTLSVSYGNQGILGVPSFSMGIGWSNAVQETSSSTAQVTQGATLKWSPDTKGAPPPADGAQAWGLFFVPTITNDRYHVYGPDKTTDLDVELYYTYISSGVELLDKVFDKTDPQSADLGKATQDYWTGTEPRPNSLTYWDPAWTGPETLISATRSDTYENILPAKHWSATTAGSADTDRYIALQNTTEKSKTFTNKIDASISAFGFSTAMSGSLSIGSSTTTTFGTKLVVTYGLPGWDASQIDPDNPPAHYNDYLRRMDVSMYLLRARNEEAFWIPDGAKKLGVQNYPWCITWHADYWESMGATTEHGTRPSVGTMLGSTQTDIERTLPLPSSLRSSVVAKLKAIKAAYDRGNKGAAANVLGALINEIEAQSGKAIPAASGEYWVDLLELVRPMIRQ